MFELAIFFPKSEYRYVLTIGKGSKFHGQSSWVSFVREDYVKNDLVYAHYLWGW